MAKTANDNPVDLDRIRELIDLLAELLVEKDVGELHVETGGLKVKIRSHGGAVATVVNPAPAALAAASAAAGTPAAGEPESPAEAAGLGDAFIVVSPMVGTFYRASEPAADPFVEVGEQVDEGQTLCIVEAMKLLNEIVADIGGELLAVFVENGEPVEYGQQLFAIRPAG